MPTDIVIPSLGESISEGVIASWLKQEGDYVERDEPVIELETDKITTEIPAPAAGVVHPSANEGDTVEVGQTIGSIEEAEKPAETEEKAEEEAAAEEEEEEKKKPAKKTRGKKRAAKSKREQKEAEEEEAEAPQARKRATEPARVGEGAASKETTGAGAPGLRGGAETHATPLARKMAQEHGVDLDQLSGTGAGGRIREQDVLAWIQTHPNGSPAAQARRESASEAPAARGAPARRTTRQRMSPLRQRIAQRLVEAQQTAAMLTTFNECDMTQVMDLRKRYKEDFEKKHEVRLGFMSFFVKACVSALNHFQRVNSQIGESDEGEPEIVHFEYCDIAVAVGAEKGLVVPVLRNCESLSFAEIESGVRDLAEKAQKGKLALEDLQGGTFTISNGGVYGSMLSTPILNPPQSAILGMHNILRRPVEDPNKPGSGETTVRPMMYLALSYDHRLIDGAEAVGFLKHVKECIEDPERLLLGV